MRRLYDVGVNCLFQGVSVLWYKRVVVNLHEVIIEGSVGAPGRADCYDWEVQVVYRVGCYGRGDG